jgi:cation diffusion facilitator family transporter
MKGKSMSGHDSAKAIYYALFANLGIAISKGVAAFITGSGSMLAETIHSFADCTNQLLLLLGMKRAQVPPDKNHPLGHGKDIYFFSFIVAMLLFSVGGMFSIYEGIHKLHLNEPVNQVWIALTVLGISIVLEMSSLFGAMKEIGKIKGEKRFGEWLKTTRSSELIVVLGEDIAAVLGLVVAFVFVILSHFLQKPIFDALGSIVIGVILVLVSIFLIIRMKDLLLGKSADPDIQDAIKKHMAKDSRLEEVLNVITIQFGPYIMLAGKIKMKKDMDITEACVAINTLEVSLKKQFPEIKWSFMEPDIVF